MEKISVHKNKELEFLITEASKIVVIGEWNDFLQSIMDDLTEHDIEKTIKKLKKELKKYLDVKESKQLVPLKSITPKNHVKPNNKLANEISKDFLNAGEIELRVSKLKAKKEITTKAMLFYKIENVSLAGKAKFTPYDREVYDGVTTLYEAGNEVITPTMVYRAMNGMIDQEYVSSQAIEAVTESLDKSMRTILKIDYLQEAQAYRKDCKATYEGYLLACEKVTVTTGGTTQEAYKLLRKPILYEYAQVSGQILSVPIKLLQTKKAVRSTDEVIVIRGYLLRQIEGMKSHTFTRNNKITFESVYSVLDISTEHCSEAMYKKKTHIIRQHVEALLSEWINQGYIKKHMQYKEGKSIKGVIITL